MESQSHFPKTAERPKLQPQAQLQLSVMPWIDLIPQGYVQCRIKVARACSISRARGPLSLKKISTPAKP